MFFICSVKDEVVDLLDVSQNLIKTLVKLYPNSISERYKVDATGISEREIFEEIAKKRGFILRGGELDYERCAKAILDDFRKGKLGKITLDVPN